MKLTIVTTCMYCMYDRYRLAEATSCWSGSCSEDEGISVHEEAIENGYDDEFPPSPREEGGNSENEIYRLVRNGNDNEKESRLIRTGTCSSL